MGQLEEGNVVEAKVSATAAYNMIQLDLTLKNKDGKLIFWPDRPSSCCHVMFDVDQDDPLKLLDLLLQLPGYPDNFKKKILSLTATYVLCVTDWLVFMGLFLFQNRFDSSYSGRTWFFFFYFKMM